MFEERRSHVFVWVAAGLLVLAVGYRLLGAGAPEPPGVEIESPGAAHDGAGAARSGPRRGRRLYVHVAGAVRRPGLYRLPRGARVAAAIERAGGTRRRADLTGTNLAAVVEDGQQIVVARRGPATGAVAAPGPAGTAGAGGTGPVSLATATQEQLEAIDGIGPTLSERIIAYRDANGGFRSVEELAEVDGIGEVRLESLRQAVTP